MNLKQLETFYWIERLGSFSAAAERLHTTQSTVSMRIQELEQSLNTKLFSRSGRSVRLTPKGSQLVPYARELIGLKAEIQERIMAQDAMSGVVKLGVIEAVATTWLPKFIQQLQERYPNITVELEVALSLELIERLQSGKFHLVFGMGRPPGPNFFGTSLGFLELRWFASPNLGLNKDVSIKSILERLPFITLDRRSYHEANIRTWMAKNKVRCRRTIVCNAISVVGMLVKSGVGITLLPWRCFEEDIESGLLTIIGAQTKMPPVEVLAMYPVDEDSALSRLLAELAVEVSDFDSTETYDNQ